MRSFFLGTFFFCSLFDACAFDVKITDNRNTSVCLCEVRNCQIGSGVLLNIPPKLINDDKKESVLFVLSCQHMLTWRTYDYFGDRTAFSTSSCIGVDLYSKLFNGFYYGGVELYKKLIDEGYGVADITVNKTNLSKDIILSTQLNHVRKTIGHLSKRYFTFCEHDIELPLDVSLLCATYVDISLTRIYDLPSSSEVANLKKHKVYRVTVYGHSGIRECEYSITCDMKLTDCGNWFKSIEPITDDMRKYMHGMSGGPCFIDDVLCGVISGCDSDRRLCVRALTADLVEAIKFGVKKMLDK